jgi:hypothetical protein
MNSFKRIVTLLVISGALLATNSCKKHTPITPLPEYGSATCGNGLFDGAEQDVDCGGFCIPCAASKLTPPCNAAFDSLYFNSVGYVTVSSVAENNSSGCNYYVLSATTNLGTMDIVMYAKPTKTRVFYLTKYDCSNTKYYPDFYFQVNLPYPNFFRSDSGKVYALVNGSSITYVFCNVSVKTNTGMDTMSGSFTL